MKNKLFILFSIFTMSFAFVDDVKVNASSKVTETIEYHNMIINVAKNEGKMIETLTLANYGVMHGDAKVDDVKEFTTYSSTSSNSTLGLTTDNAHASEHWRIKSVKNDGVIAVFTAKENISVDIVRDTIGGDWTEHAQIGIYKKSNEVVSTIYEKTFENDNHPKEDFSYNDIVLATGETLYYQFIFRGCEENDKHRNMINLPKFILETYQGEVPEIPPVEEEDTLKPGDYSNSTSISLTDMALEVALRNGDPVILKDMEVNLLQGNVLTSTRKFEKYTISGENDSRSVLISDVDEFNSPESAAFTTWRINTTSNSSAIFEIKATSDISLTITHPAINGGWIDNTGQYFGLYIKENEKVYTQWKKPIIEPTSTENEYGATIMLKSGDTCYYTFGSTDGANRNVNIIPTFTASTENYNEDVRNEQLVIGDETITMWDALTATINNNYQDVDYNLVSYGFYYGTMKEHTHFNYHVGDGTGTEKDALWDSATQNTGFVRWQMQCSSTKDAIIKISAKEDINISLTHPAVWVDAWSTFTSIRYYAIDEEGTRALIKNIPIQEGTDDTYFALEVSLHKGESLYIDYYTTTEEWGSIDFRPTINASCKDFDEAKTVDFASIKALNVLKQNKINEINAIYETLNSDDYSISNWGKIENFISDVLTSIEEVQDETTLNQVVNEAKANINSVKTKDVELAELNTYKQEKVKELNDLLSSINKKEYTEENYQSIKTKVEEITAKINNATTKTSIDTLMKNASAFINKVDKKVDKTEKGCTGSVATSSLTLLGLLSILLKKKEK